MFRDLSASLRPALVLTALFFALTGLAYPALVTGLAQALFPSQAQGSLVSRDGRVVGSALIGQSFASPGYFHPRPSAAGASSKGGYDPLASGGSNYGPTSKALVDRVKADRATAEKFDGMGTPADLLLASGSGLDPHISPASARYQAARVATARHLPLAQVQALIDRTAEAPLAGFIGEPRVNVLMLNLALDSMAKPGAQTRP